eukprot:m.167202 g.167202  ORF g.167202 m.167202 type:complete len:992 (-) comp14722_c0_seq5:220-3195(-)
MDMCRLDSGAARPLGRWRWLVAGTAAVLLTGAQAAQCPPEDNCMYLSAIPEQGFTFEWLASKRLYKLPYGEAAFGPCPTNSPPNYFRIESPWYSDTRSTVHPSNGGTAGLIALYLNSTVTPERDTGPWWRSTSSVIETVLPSESLHVPLKSNMRRIIFYNFAVVDGDVMVPAANLSFQFKGGFRCSWQPIQLTEASRSPAVLGFWDVTPEVGRITASEDGAWCHPQIQAIFNGVQLSPLDVSEMTASNGTGFVVVMGGIGSGPVEVRGYSFQQCPDPEDPDHDWSSAVLGVIFGWAAALCAVFTTVVFVYSRHERLVLAEEMRFMTRTERRSSLRARRRSFKERMTLTPLQKFARHGKFPWKLLCHLLTVLFAVSYICLHNVQFSSFVSANEQSFRSMLGFDSGLSTTALDFTAIYTVPQLETFIDSAITNYFKYSLTSIGEVSTESSLVMRQTFWNGTIATSEITAESGGPFSNLTPHEARVYADSLEKIVINFIFRNKLSATQKFEGYMPYATTRFKWDLEATWDFSDDAQAVYLLRILATLEDGPVTVLVTLSVVIIFLCCTSIVLNVKALWKSLKVYRHTKQRLENTGEEYTNATLPWSAVSMMDKLAFFNLWHVWNLLGDSALIIASGLVAHPLVSSGGYSVDQVHRELTAEQLTRCVGTLITLFSTVKYMEHYPEFYLLVVAVRGSITRVFKFICMVMPFYLGYVLVGVYSFPTHVQLFGTVWQSARTLFALLHGDSVLELYQLMCRDGDYAYCAFAQVYLYSFCIIFIVVVLNVFIFIIETGYEKAQRSTGRHDERPLMLDHDRLHRVLDAAEKAVAKDEDAELLAVANVFETSLTTAQTPAQGEDDSPLLSPEKTDSGDLDESFTNGSSNGNGVRFEDDFLTDKTVRMEEIVRAAVEECTRKIIRSEREAGTAGGGLRRQDSMSNEGTEALLSENEHLRNELTASEKVVALLQRDLQTLTAAVTNLRRAQAGQAMQHWSTING